MECELTRLRGEFRHLSGTVTRARLRACSFASFKEQPIIIGIPGASVPDVALFSRAFLRALRRELARVMERVDCIHIFVAPDRFDSWEAQRESTCMADARLDGIERHIEHNVRFHLAISAVVRNGVLL